MISSWSSKKVLNYMTSSSVWYFPAKCLLFFSCWETENSQIHVVPNQENMEGDQPVQSHSHTQQPLQPQTCVQENCPGETGLPCQFSSYVNKMSLVLYMYFSKPSITYPVWVIWNLEGNNAVSIRKGFNTFNACQILSLWHNSFLVSLWTFQPTLVSLIPASLRELMRYV